jgi:hypothetical protein
MKDRAQLTVARQRATMRTAFTMGLGGQPGEPLGAKDNLVKTGPNKSRKFGTYVVDFVAAKAAKTHKDQQGLGSRR